MQLQTHNIDYLSISARF